MRPWKLMIVYFGAAVAGIGTFGLKRPAALPKAVWRLGPGKLQTSLLLFLLHQRLPREHRIHLAFALLYHHVSPWKEVPRPPGYVILGSQTALHRPRGATLGSID
jgi:hypothetical protein